MANEIEIDVFGFLCQLATFSEWHSPKFGTLDFKVTEDALRKIFPWESKFTNVRSGSLSERLYLPSLKAGDEVGSAWLRYEADLDIMFMPEKAVIKEPGLGKVEENKDDSTSEVIAFIENAETPRYVKLRTNTACKWKLPDEILESEGGNVYISSSKFSEVFRKHLPQIGAQKAAGPSQLVTSEHIQQMNSFGILESVDLVFAFRCPEWPSVAVEWVDRKRNWPPAGTIQALIQQGCAVVAKGFPGSETSHLEWRLSFSLAETELARNLTPVQRRCYLLVKSIIKDLKCNFLPSYYIKCSFYWLLEEEKAYVWRNTNLGNCVLIALNRLVKFLQCYTLPNYFVRERNLLQTVPKEDCEMLSGALKGVIANPIHCFANSPKVMGRLESVLSASPEEQGYSKLVVLLREFDGCSPGKVDALKDLLKFHFNNLGLTLLIGEPETAQKGLEYIQCVVDILKGAGKNTNALELLCNFLVRSTERGDGDMAPSRLVSMRILGFPDDEIISALSKATGSTELAAHLYNNAGCFYHAQAYNDSDDPFEPIGELLSHAEAVLRKAVDLQPDKASHHVELSMFLYRNDRFEEAISAAKRGIPESKSSDTLEYLEYGKSEELTLDGNLGYHVQQNGSIEAPALVFAYYVLVACLEELDRKDEALQLMSSYKAACEDPRKSSCKDDSMVLFNFSCLLLKITEIQ